MEVNCVDNGSAAVAAVCSFSDPGDEPVADNGDSMSRLTPSILCAITLFAAAAAAETPAVGPGATASAGGSQLSREQIAADVLAAMDRTVDPCQDFYRYACGTWIASTALPPDQPRWVRSFSVVREQNRTLLREIIEEAAAGARSADHANRLVGDYFGACMDEDAVEKAGTTVLDPIFSEIDRVGDARSLLAVTGALYRRDIEPLFGIDVFADLKDPGTNVAHLVQGGIGLPDRDYYVSDDPTKREILAAYEAHVARMLALVGEGDEAAAAHAAQVVAFETKLATVSRDRTAMRELDQQHHRLDRAGLAELTPGLPWEAFFDAAGHAGVAEINVRTPEFFAALEGLVVATDPAVLRSYLRWTAVDQVADQLPAAFVEANFEFYGRKLSGQQELEPRWKRCVSATSDALSEPVGRLYVDRSFAGDSKEKALEMINDIEAAFDANLDSLAWMDDGTKWRAHRKLVAVRNKIGYPDRWRDYSSLRLTPSSYFANAAAVAAFDLDFAVGKVGKPVDRNEWNFLSPQTVNAGYNPTGNEMLFPAGILQPPFFHRDFPAAMNYGAIGLGIGHELTHGYDDQGRKFDPTGAIHEWWEPEVAERYEQRAQCVADYYGALEVEPGVHVNGQLTLGENIADIGGLKLAHRAYQRWLERHGDPQPLIEGLSDDQLLYVAAAQLWCTVVSPEYLRQAVTTDPHTPDRFRASGPMANNPAFAEAFECEPGTPMSPAQSCEVW
jgi:predicted metalloendopeptidase